MVGITVHRRVTLQDAAGTQNGLSTTPRTPTSRGLKEIIISAVTLRCRLKLENSSNMKY